MRPRAPVTDGNTFNRQGDLWSLHFAGRDVQLRDSKGMRDLATLLAQPGSYVAALDLSGHVPGEAGEFWMTARAPHTASG